MISIKKISLLLIWLIGISNTLYSQESRLAKDSLQIFNWEASIDLYGLIRNGEGKVYLKYANRPNSAYRISILGGISNTSAEDKFDLNGNSQNGKYVERGNSFGLSLGHEWRKNKKKHQLYFGVELDLYRSQQSHSYPFDWQGPKVGSYQIYRIGILPFVGVKYHLTNRLSISSECSLDFSHAVNKNLRFNSNEVISIGKSTGIYFKPFRLINVSYHF